MMLLACIGPTYLNHGDMYDLRYSLSSIILYSGALMRSFLAFCGSFGRTPPFMYSRMGTIQLSSSSLTTSVISFYATDLVCMTSTKTSFASFEKVIDASLPRASAFLFCSLLMCSIEYPAMSASFTIISPAPGPSKLEAPSVNSFHVFYGSGSFLLASPFFSSLSLGDVSARKSASICPLIEFLPLNSISCSPSSMAHLATRPDFSGFAKTCFIGMSLRTCIGCAWKYLWSFLAAYTRASMSFSNSGYFCSASFSVRLTKYTGACFFPLATSNTGLTFLFEAARYTVRSHLCLLSRVFMKGRAFSVLFERNLFRAANFLPKLCISLTVLGGCRADIAFTLEGSALIPCFVIR
ncbi:hypothetical protein Tco_0871561 [Tanacetum coccineum]